MHSALAASAAAPLTMSSDKPFQFSNKRFNIAFINIAQRRERERNDGEVCVLVKRNGIQMSVLLSDDDDVVSVQ